MYNQPPKQQPMLALMGLSADPAKARILLDPNMLNPNGGTAIDWFVPSPDGSLVAVSLSEGGSENGTLHVYDVATRKEIGDPIPNVQYPTAGGSMAWQADSKGFWYTRYPTVGPEQDRHFYQQVYFHVLGTQPDKDKLSLGRDFPNPKVAEVALDNHFDPNGLLAIVRKWRWLAIMSIYALNRLCADRDHGPRSRAMRMASSPPPSAPTMRCIWCRAGARRAARY